MPKRNTKAVDDTVAGRYKFGDVSTTWEDAEKKCKEIGAHLVTMETKSEWESIVNLIKQKINQSDGDVFIGLRKGNGEWDIEAAEESNAVVEIIPGKPENLKSTPFTHWYIGLRKENGNWQWKTGNTISDDDDRWQPHEPSDTTGESCGEINAEYPKGVYGHFNNVRCTRKYSSKYPRGYICEIDSPSGK